MRRSDVISHHPILAMAVRAQQCLLSVQEQQQTPIVVDRIRECYVAIGQARSRPAQPPLSLTDCHSSALFSNGPALKHTDAPPSSTFPGRTVNLNSPPQRSFHYLYLTFGIVQLDVLLIPFLCSNARFRGSNSKSPGPSKTASGSSQPPLSPLSLDRSQNSQSPASAGLSTNLPALPRSPSLAQTIGMDEQGIMAGGQDVLESYHLPRPLPLWLNPNYAKHIVKGNFMTLSARPKTVEQGEWIAHQGMYTFTHPGLHVRGC